MAMIRKVARSDYQIGIYAVQREGKVWIAATDRLGFRKEFPTLAAAYLELTGEPLHELREPLVKPDTIRSVIAQPI